MARVVVFGGSGFLGRWVVEALAKDGWEVTVPTRSLAKAQALKTAGLPGQVVPIALNIGDDTALKSLLSGAVAVVNLVGILYEKGRQRFTALHTDFPRRLGQACAAAGIHQVVQLSAIGANSRSLSHYARSKGEGEAALRQAVPAAIILRPSLVVGPGDGFFGRFAAMAAVSPVLPLIGGGAMRFQPVYVGDVAAAVMAALRLPGAPGNTYELGGPQVYTFRQLLERLAVRTGRRRWLLRVPFALARPLAFVSEFLPVPPLTRDQLRLLRVDNVVPAGAKTLADLGITPSAEGV